MTDTLTGITSITAGTWNYNFPALESNASANFPITTTNKAVRITLYVWRPSTQTKVGDILDGNSNLDVDEALTTGTGRANITAFTGSAVTVSDGDVICFEVWFPITQQAATAYTDTFYYDGTTVTLTKNTATSNHASFIETSQVLVFGAPAGPVDCTVTGKTLYNKTTRHG